MILQGKPLRMSAPAENIEFFPILRIGSFTMHFPYFVFPSEVSGETDCSNGLALAAQLNSEPAAATAALPVAIVLTNPLLVELPLLVFGEVINVLSLFAKTASDFADYGDSYIPDAPY